MTIKLREDQMMLVERVLQNIKEDNLVVSPSGSGKSYILAYLEKLLTEQGYLVYVYAPTIEVREQLDELMKGNGSNNKTRGVIEDINSNNDAPDYLLIDEAHHSEADTYQLLFEKYPKAVKIGFSATPERLDGKGLDNSYQNIIIGKTVRELIDNHILSDYKYYAPSTTVGFQYSISPNTLDYDIFSVNVEHKKTSEGVNVTDLTGLFDWLDEQEVSKVPLESFLSFQNSLLLEGESLDFAMSERKMTQKEIEELADKLFDKNISERLAFLEGRDKR